jgi:hypothetical protein
MSPRVTNWQMIQLRNDSGFSGTIDNKMAVAGRMPLTGPISFDGAKGAHTSTRISAKQPTCRRTPAALPVKKKAGNGGKQRSYAPVSRLVNKV